MCGTVYIQEQLIKESMLYTGTLYVMCRLEVTSHTVDLRRQTCSHSTGFLDMCATCKKPEGPGGV